MITDINSASMEMNMASITQVVHFVPMIRPMCALMRSNSNREIDLSTRTIISKISYMTFVWNPRFTSTNRTGSLTALAEIN